MTNHSKILEFIGRCEDSDKLRSLIKNARERGEHEVANVAFKKLISLVPSEQPGTVGHDLWQTIYAFEHVLTEERGKTTRLQRTRQKLARSGVVETLAGWCLRAKATTGFQMLIDREMPELTGEAIVLRHAALFEPDVVDAARRRLVGAGVEVSRLPSKT